jgi:VWFA-related protein
LRAAGAAGLVATLVASLDVAALGGQEAQFRTATEVLRIQVGLRDSAGLPAVGLGVDDLELLVDGEPRRILDLYEIDATQLEVSAAASMADVAPRGPAATLESTVLEPTAGATLPTAARRRFMLFFDLGFITRRGLGYARGAATDFLDEIIHEGDLVGLATYSAWRGLQYHVPFTSDRDQIRREIDGLGIGRAAEAVGDQGLDLLGLAQVLALTPPDGVPTSSLVDELERSAQQLEAGRVIMALERLSEEIAPIQGRKHIVYFSEGIPDALLFDPEAGDAGNVRDMTIAMESARRSDVVIHSFYPAAMPTSGVHDIREMVPGNSAGRFEVFADRTFLSYAAEETGGSSVYFRHQLRRGLEEVEEATRSYYVLAFPLAESDRESVRLEVVPRRADVTVAWAPERLTLPTWQQHSIAARQLQVADALEVGNDARSMEVDVLAIRVQRQDDYGRVAIAGEIPAHQLRALLEERGEDRLDLEILGVALEPDGQVADYFRTRINLENVAAQLDNVSIPLRYQNVLAVRPGSYFVKVLVREGEVSRLASRSLRLEIPATDPEDLAIDTPLMVVPARSGSVIRGVNPTSPPPHRLHLPLDYPFVVGAQDLVPLIHPTSVAGADVDLFVTVRNPSVHPFDGTTDIAADCWLQDADGNRFVLSDFRPLSSDYDRATGSMRMLLRLSLAPNLPNGSYSLVVRAHDRIAGSAVASYTQLAVEAAFQRVQ